MRINDLRRALDIVAQYRPDEEIGVWDDGLILCDADVPFTDNERTELISLGFAPTNAWWLSGS